MSQLQRVIRKYPNRRLYDTSEGRYITHDEIRRLVLNDIDFVVIEKRTQTDITRSVLLQVIVEQEHGGAPAMSRDFLSQIIRSCSGSLQGVLGPYLDQSVAQFVSEKRESRPDLARAGETLASLASGDYERWRHLQDEIYRALARV
jgi:polyhydroxyalkanoate synthesis repressor PhaR